MIKNPDFVADKIVKGSVCRSIITRSVLIFFGLIVSIFVSTLLSSRGLTLEAEPLYIKVHSYETETGDEEFKETAEHQKYDFKEFLLPVTYKHDEVKPENRILKSIREKEPAEKIVLGNEYGSNNSKLPDTGGIGAYTFYIIGVITFFLLMIIAFMFARQNKSKH